MGMKRYILICIVVFILSFLGAFGLMWVDERSCSISGQGGQMVSEILQRVSL